MIPGVGRAVWSAGSSGGGTGRTNAWNTYDGTADTAWQQWVDDTSTAITSSYDVTTSKGASNSYGNRRCWLAIQNGTTGYIGYVMADQDDATNCQIKLVNAGTVGNINIAGRVGSVVLTTATEDNGSLIAFKESADNISSSGKISGLFPYTDGSTDALQLTGHWRQWSYAATDPFTGSSTTYAGNFYNQGSTEFTYDGVTYLAWPANRTTTYLWLQMPMRYESGITIDRVAPVALYKIDNLLDLFNTPSAAVEQLETDTSLQSDNIYFGRYNNADQPSTQPLTVSGTVVATNGTYSRVEDTVVVPGATPTYTTSPMTWNTYTLKNWSSRTGSPEDYSPYIPNDGLANTTALIQGYATEEYERTTFQDVNFGNIEQWEGSSNTWANYGLNILHNHKAASGRPASAGKFTQMIQVGNSLVCLISNLIDETDEIGVPYIYGATLNPNAIRHEDTYSATKPDKMLIEDRLDVGTNTTAMVNDTGVSSLAVTVSDTNNSDSTNAAYEPDYIRMAHLTLDYFCVVWRKSTTAYISIFEVNQQVSDQPTFTRHAEINLGTVPEGNISVTPMGTGVALITCGNYYKFIKVPV